MNLAVHPEVVAALQSGRDSVECAWLLLGTNDEAVIVVSAAVRVGQGDQSSVAIDRVSAFKAVSKLRQRDQRLTIIGFAHSHPTGHSDPSVFDFRGDSRWVSELPSGVGVFGIIAKGLVRWFYLAVGDRWCRTVQKFN